MPTLLIIKQPDYGTALAFLVALIFMLYVAGIKQKYIITAVLLVVILVPLAYLFILPDHAKARIDVYLNPKLRSKRRWLQHNTIKISNRSWANIWNGTI